ncbi:MAG: chemotaxis response regulator protein-glutamate methylesterase [Chitinispirillaceae bacterium]
MIKVLVVDDSAVVRQVLSRELSKASDIQVVAAAVDPYDAREKIVRYKPDVLTLDIEMPRMDGLAFLRKLMQHYPVPAIIVSSLTPRGGQVAMEALDIGAVDVICKPGSSYTVGDITYNLAQMIRAASKVDPSSLKRVVSGTVKAPVHHSLTSTTSKIIAIGASTGGTRALEQLLVTLPANAPGIVIVQHMPEHFTKSFAERLNSISQIQVKEANSGDSVVNGTALIAPGNLHTIVKRSGARYIVQNVNAPRVFHQRPSVEVMFNSAAKYVGKNAVGVLLTGMGADGARGLLEMKNAGAPTIAQDEATSVVWGMPGEAVKQGAAQYVLPLQQIAQKMLSLTT